MSVEFKVAQLEQAQELIYEAIDLIKEAIHDTTIESAAEAYIIKHLENWADGTNPHDETSIPKIIQAMKI